jgi:hypothetical protein
MAWPCWAPWQDALSGLLQVLGRLCGCSGERATAVAAIELVYCMIVWWQTLYIIYIWYIIISLRFTSRTRCRTRRVIQCSSWTWLAARWSSEQWCPDRRTCAAVRLVRDRQPSTIHATQVHAAELTAAELTASVLAQQQSVLSSCCCCCCCCCCLATAPRPRCPRQRFGPAITCRGRRRRRRRQTLPCSASLISAQSPPCHALSHACLAAARVLSRLCHRPVVVAATAAAAAAADVGAAERHARHRELGAPRHTHPAPQQLRRLHGQPSLTTQHQLPFWHLHPCYTP